MRHEDDPLDPEIPVEIEPRVRHVIAVAGSRGGVGRSLVAVNLAFEAEKMGDNVSLSAKLGWRF